MSLTSPALAGRFFTPSATWKTCSMMTKVNNIAFSTENLLDFRFSHGKMLTICGDDIIINLTILIISLDMCSSEHICCFP